MSAAVTTAGDSPAERRGLARRRASRGIFGAAAVILGIVGLAMPAAQPAVPQYLAAVAGLVLGLVLIALGLDLSNAYARLLAQDTDLAQFGDPLTTPTADLVIGAAVVILGILAILSVASTVLVTMEAILIGSGLLLSAGASVRLANIEAAATLEPPLARRIAGELAIATAGIRMAAGVAALVLGILGVIGTEPISLALVAMIVAGAATLVDSNTFGNRLLEATLR